MRTSAAPDSNLVDLYDKLDPRERYDLLKREERLRAKGVPLTFYYQYSRREEIKRMSSKKKRSGGQPSHNGLSLKRINPRTENQEETIEAYQDGYNLLLHGVAGTGKTFLSLWCALKDVLDDKYQKVIILRSVVPSRDMGFLPGTAKEKAAIYESPYQAICSELFGRGDAYEILKQKGLVEFVTTSHIRGTTFRDSVVLVDEIQNCNFEELDTIITRVGENSRIIFCGDLRQTDLYRSKYDQSGLPRFLDIMDRCESFEFIEFGEEDIVRSGLVKEWIIAKLDYEDDENEGNKPKNP